MIYEGEDQLQQLQADGKITEHDADEVRTFAAFLTDQKRLGTEAALREHYPDDPTLAALDRERERRAQAGQQPRGDENSPPDGPEGRPRGC